jgi:ribosomal protein L29
VKYSELSALSDEQLVHRELSLERTLTGHMIRHRLGKLENTSLLRKIRGDIARVQTALTSRELTASVPRGSLRSRHAGSYVPEAIAPASEAGGGFLSGMLDNKEATE